MTYDELLKDRLEEYHYQDDTISVSTAFLDMLAKDYATMKCKELLEMVAEKAEVKTVTIPNGLNIKTCVVDVDSILNVVDLETFCF